MHKKLNGNLLVNLCLYMPIIIVSLTLYTVYWEIFEVQNFRGLVILKFFANKFSRMVIYTGNGHMHVF